MAVFIGLFGIACLTLAAVNPRRTWARPRGPETREPSPAVVVTLRVALLVMAVPSAWWAADGLRLAKVASDPDHDDIVERMDTAAEEMRSGAPRQKYAAGDGAWAGYIVDEIRRPGEEVVLRLASASANTERYEADGVCLTVVASVAPGEPEPKYAHIDDRHYNLEADVKHRPCP
ncbi:hypothetical protein ACFWOY_19945 [Streptomyces sp. NPDC058423]|uniref:hypothetical protein n=1 Tax=unclassified Streptomyces TaxID=2593676 RepID=UPI003653EE2E